MTPRPKPSPPSGAAAPTAPGARTRRELVARAARAPSDASWLLRLIELEALAEAAYGLAIESGSLTPRARRLAEALRAQERAHARALAAQLGQAPTAPPGAAAIRAALRATGIDEVPAAAAGERAWFTLLEQLESVLEGAYYAALADLLGEPAIILAASILASEAQHSTLLFRRRHPRDISLAVGLGLITGTPPPHHP